MSKLYGDEEGVCIRTLNDTLLESFRLGEKVTITVKGEKVSRTLSCTVDELEGTEEVEDYSTSINKKGPSKPKYKTRPGEIYLVVGTDKPEKSMADYMEEDEED